ncbi:hypothetical protein F7725_009624 [Dissostichus mawsoni]|uniref:Uncharacterized protein n=1 Tax=Dissostichus mawsoni TaxID=36200 RepID=A0A7J5XL75_DISMA|nr:hypothetical protein F7725_009624 [Dissostichus mawsoni]
MVTLHYSTMSGSVPMTHPRCTSASLSHERLDAAGAPVKSRKFMTVEEFRGCIVFYFHANEDQAKPPSIGRMPVTLSLHWEPPHQKIRVRGLSP